MTKPLRALALTITIAMLPSTSTLAQTAKTPTTATTPAAPTKKKTPASFAGDWEGAIAVPGSPLVVTIHIGEGRQPTATLDIPAQKLKAQPLDKVVVDDAIGRASASFAAVGATFDGFVDGDTWKGTFTQGGTPLPFSLTRQRRDVVARARLEAVAAAIDSARATASIPGVGVGVVVDGKVVWAKGFGLRDVDKKLPVTPQTLFMIGSTTKAFTTAALGTLQDQGVLKLKDRVRQHLPVFALGDARDDSLTLEDLASHGTGVDRADLVWYLQPPTSRSELLAQLPSLKMSMQPREGFIYNNWMYAVLGMVVEDAAKVPFAEAVRRRLLAPLGMTSTSLDGRTAKTSKDKATAYDRIDDTIAAVPWHVNPQMLAAGSATVSNVDDMNRWLAFHLGDGKAENGKRLLEAATLTQLHTPVRVANANLADPDEPISAYAFGWGASSWRGHTRVAHGGGIDGFLTLVTLMPSDGIGVFVVQNASHTALHSAITDQILEALLELPSRNKLTTSAQKAADILKKPLAEQIEPPIIVRPGTTTSHALSAYVGTYTSAEFKKVVVELVGGKLTVTLGKTVLTLKHGHFDSFLVDTVNRHEIESLWKQAAFSFTTGLDGDIDGIETVIPSMGELVLTRESTPPTKAQLAKLARTYALDSFVVTVGVAGDGLQLTVPGQPVYAMRHERGLRFKLSLEGFAATFVVDDAGAPVMLVMHQPQGTVRLTPKT